MLVDLADFQITLPLNSFSLAVTALQKMEMALAPPPLNLMAFQMDLNPHAHRVLISIFLLF